MVSGLAKLCRSLTLHFQFVFITEEQRTTSPSWDIIRDDPNGF